MEKFPKKPLPAIFDVTTRSKLALAKIHFLPDRNLQETMADRNFIQAN